MNDPLDNKLREAGWRGKLTPAEEADLRAWLAAHPEARADWEAEMALNRALAGLPDAPMPSNFTARVCQAVERDQASAGRGGSRWTWRRLLPRIAVAGAVVAVSLFAYDRREDARRAEMAKGVAAVSDVAGMLDPEVLRNFDAIRLLGQTPAADQELVALMQPE